MKSLIPLLLLLFCINSSSKAQDSLARYTLKQLNTKIDNNINQENYQQAQFYIDYCLQNKTLADTILIDIKTSEVFIYQYQGELDKALELMTEIETICKNNLGEKHKYYAYCLNNIASIYYDKNELSVALDYFQRSVSILEENKQDNNFHIQSIKGNIGSIYYYLEEYEKATSIFRENIDYYRKNNIKTTDYAYVLTNLAMSYTQLGYYEMAYPLQEEALIITQKYKKKNGIDEIYTSTYLASILSKMHRYKEAITLLLPYARICQEHYSYDMIYPEILLDLANCYINNQQPEKGAQFIDQILSIDKNIPHLTNIKCDALETKINLSINKGNLTAAKEHIDALNKTMLKLKNSKALYRQISLLLEIKLSKKEQNYIQFQKALEALTYELFNEHIPLTLNNQWFEKIQLKVAEQQMYALNTKRYLSCCLSYIQSAPNISERPEKEKQLITFLNQRIDNHIHTLGSTASQIRQLKEKRLLSERLLKIQHTQQIKYPMFLTAEQTKAMLLYKAGQAQQKNLESQIPLVIKEKLKKLEEQKEALKIQYEDKKGEEKAAILPQLSTCHQQVDALRREIQAKYLKNSKQHTFSLELKEIQRKLPASSALIEYVLANDALYIFRIDKDDFFAHAQEVDGLKLKERIWKYYNLLKTPKPFTEQGKLSQEGFELYKLLLAPVLKDKSAVDKLIIIPDAELSYLPFETLIKNPIASNINRYNDLDYLVKHYAISYNMSVGVWHQNLLTQKRNNNREILAVAANYSQKSEQSTSTSTRLGNFYRKMLLPLPAARKEVEALQSEFKGKFLFDSLANETRIKSLVQDYAILHFALHGITDTLHPERSSLVFTDIANGEDNNFWQAYEIAREELNAELVVLSACETGFGKYQPGNAVASLARSFMFANVPALLVSLWAVNDQATSFLMIQFYKGIKEGTSKDLALQQAKLGYLNQFKGMASHPAFWSPFIQMGDTKSISLKGPSQKNYALLSTIAILILAIILFVKKKK